VTDQFGSFCGLDNRKTVMDLFRRLGRGLPERQAGMMRAGFLQGLIVASTSFPSQPLIVTPCSAAEAYHLFIAITGCLGVDIDQAAGLLEEVVRHGEAGNRDERRGKLPHRPGAVS
jgi:hypothetical protein